MTHVAGVAPDSYRDSGYPSRILAWTTVILLLSAYAVSLVDRQILSLLIEPVRRHFEITDTQISLLAGIAFVIFYTLLGLPFGRWADTGNRRNIVVAGMLLWCVATVCCGLAGNLLTLFLARMLVGVGEAALGPSAYSLIADSSPPGPRARAISVSTTGVFLGTGSARCIPGLPT
ncbi:MAG: MFS transporter [Proteobacteria bacterium]|nr:MFS transporter [Pseudomonadota bacterium]